MKLGGGLVGVGLEKFEGQSGYDQYTIYTCIKFLKNKLKVLY